MSVGTSSAQYGLRFIEHEYHGEVIKQRAKDGYVNATAMCKAGGKQWAQFVQNKETQEYLAALSAKVGIPTNDLFQSVSGVGTWVHPQLAIRLAMWISGDFAVQVTDWVYEWMSNGAKPHKATHDYVQRYSANVSRVPKGYFSILAVVYQDLYGPLEHAGKILASKAANGTAICPDISVGKMFAKWLRDLHPDKADNFVTYVHVYLDGREIPDARAYPMEMYPRYRDFWETVWLPKQSPIYLKARDPVAAALLPAILPASAPPPKLLGR